MTRLEFTCDDGRTWQWSDADAWAAEYWTEDRTSESLEVLPASDYLEELKSNEPRRALFLLESAANAAPTARALCELGAGPAEDLLRHCGTGPELIADAEQIAGRCAPFREALECLWTGDEMPEDLRARLRLLGADSA